MDKKEKILKAFEEANGPLKPGDVATSTGIDKGEVSKIIKDLKNEGKIISPKRCFYSVP